MSAAHRARPLLALPSFVIKPSLLVLKTLATDALDAITKPNPEMVCIGNYSTLMCYVSLLVPGGGVGPVNDLRPLNNSNLLKTYQTKKQW